MSSVPPTTAASNPAPSPTRWSLTSLVWLAWMLALTLSFVGFAAANLESFRPVSADENTIMAVSAKLAQQGTLGTDLYQGFYNADRHFFVNLPAQHFWQALVFRLAGMGIVQARLVSLFFAIVMLWTVGWLAWRWYDAPTSFVATFLFLFWRSDLVAIYPGLPVLGVARSARYDATVVAWVWLTLAAFTALAARPSRGRALAAGLCAGVAALTHFVGFFVVPVVAVAWLSERRRGGLRGASIGWMLAGFLALLLPYLVWIGLYLGDYSGQMAKYGDRAAFGAPAFWLQNIASELQRYRPLTLGLQRWGNPNQATIGPTLLLAVLAPSLGYLAVRLWRFRCLGDRLLATSLLTFIVLLALMEQTKASLYAFILWPGLCLATAMTLVALLRWAFLGPGLGAVRVGAVAAIIAFLGFAAWDGRQGYETDWEQMGQVTSYRSLGNQIATAMPRQAPMLGEYRWWWALRSHPYQGLNTVYFIARDVFVRTGQLPNMAELLAVAADGGAPEYILVNNNFVGAQFDFPSLFRQQFWDWMAACATIEQEWDDRTYGRITLYRVESGRAACLAPAQATP